MNKLIAWLLARPTRPVWGVVVALLLLNAFLLAYIIVGPGPAAARPAPATTSATHPAAGHSFLADTLRLSPDQRARYDVLRAGYLQQVRTQTQTCRQDCQRYFLLLDSTNLSDAELARRSRAALASKVAVDVLTVRHLQQVSALCVPAQRRTLRQVLAPDCTPANCLMIRTSAEQCLPNSLELNKK